MSGGLSKGYYDPPLCELEPDSGVICRGCKYQQYIQSRLGVEHFGKRAVCDAELVKRRYAQLEPKDRELITAFVDGLIKQKSGIYPIELVVRLMLDTHPHIAELGMKLVSLYIEPQEIKGWDVRGSGVGDCAIPNFLRREETVSGELLPIPQRNQDIMQRGKLYHALCLEPLPIKANEIALSSFYIDDETSFDRSKATENSFWFVWEIFGEEIKVKVTPDILLQAGKSVLPGDVKTGEAPALVPHTKYQMQVATYGKAAEIKHPELTAKRGFVFYPHKKLGDRLAIQTFDISEGSENRERTEASVYELYRASLRFKDDPSELLKYRNQSACAAGNTPCFQRDFCYGGGLERAIWLLEQRNP